MRGKCGARHNRADLDGNGIWKIGMEYGKTGIGILDAKLQLRFSEMEVMDWDLGWWVEEGRNRRRGEGKGAL